MFFMSSIIYRRLQYYFNDNNKSCLFGLFMLILQYGLKNMIIGDVQALLRSHTALSLIIVFSIECAFMLTLLISINFSIYRLAYRIWIFILINLSKILLISTFFWEQNGQNNVVLEGVQQFILFLQISTFILGIASEIVYLFV